MLQSRSRVIFALVLAALTLTAAWAQTVAQTTRNVDVRRVGHRLACQCGCVDTVATCSMLECSFCVPVKQKIARMQSAGTSDADIIKTFVAEYGEKVYRAEPNAFGWIVPYASILLGLAMIYWFIRRYYARPQPAVAGAPADMPEIEDGELAKYRAQIEKDLSRLD